MDPSLENLNVSALLRAHGLAPKKSLGQNYLTDVSILNAIVQVAELKPDDNVLEIGPGIGSLTRFLAQSAKKVVAVELDGKLIPLLTEVVSTWKNIQIIQGDILEQNLSLLMGKDPFVVVANIPYYITSALIRHILESTMKPDRIVLTIQREVAQRICAQPGDYSLLALSVQIYGEPKAVLQIPAGAFYPRPDVDSTVLKINLFPEPRIPVEMLDDFFVLAKAGFRQKRKTIKNALSSGINIDPFIISQMLVDSIIDPMRRAETLSITEWKQIVLNYRDVCRRSW